METIWKFLDGKKTNIGAGICTAAALLLGIAQIWQIDAVWFSRMVESMNYVGGFLAGGGLIHKAMKGKGI